MELAVKVPTTRACQALNMPRSSFYRARSEPKPRPATKPRPKPARMLSEAERERVRKLLNTEFVDAAPRTAYAALLDRGERLCGWRTMYRILAEKGELRERRRQRRHPKRVKPRLCATRSNEVWTWDITKLRGPRKGELYYLYTVLDIFSRYVVGWMLARRESAELARQLIAETATKEGIVPESLTIHSDRGAPMTARSMAQLLAELGVTRSLSRPRVPDDNPFCEAHFKTVKYHPTFPGRFDGFEHCLDYCRTFVPWYNEEHYHSGIALLTPWMRHHGKEAAVLAERQVTLDRAYAANPDRFVHGRPIVSKPPDEVWINEPEGLEVTATGAAAEHPATDTVTLAAPQPAVAH